MRPVSFQIVLGPVELVDEVDSTNRVLLERARSGAPHGLVLVADHQTAGRGRLDRRWEAPPGAALLVSVLVRPDVAVARAHLLTFAAGLAAVEACEAAGAAVGLKWPNDVVRRGDATAKLAGMLAESIVGDGRLAAVVLGMGLNLHPGGFPDGAVALDDLAGHRVERGEVLADWLAGLDRRLGSLDAVTDEYRVHSETIGARVRVVTSDGDVEGTATDIDGDGHLVVEAAHGRHVVTAGDVVHVRPI